MFEFVVCSKKHLEGEWYDNTYQITPTKEQGDVFKYTSRQRYESIGYALYILKEIVDTARKDGIDIIDIQIKKTR